jgi:hypothetical protein
MLMHNPESIDAPLLDHIAASHRVMRLTLLGVPFMALVLLLSVRSIHFWWYGFLYGISFLLGGFQLRWQRGVLVLAAPGEVRAWMRVASLALGASGAILLALSAWQIGRRLAGF